MLATRCALLTACLVLASAAGASAATKAPRAPKSAAAPAPRATGPKATRDDAPPPAPPPAPAPEKSWWQVLEERFLRRCDNPWADDPPDGKK